MAEEAPSQEHEPERIVNPGPNDVLCGKDKSCVHAPGSIRFRSIIESYRERYASCLTKFDKMLITKEIYEMLSESSRFLKFNSKEKVWEEISPMSARDKVGHALRFANRLKSSKKKPIAPTGQAAPELQAGSLSGHSTPTSTDPTTATENVPATVTPTNTAARDPSVASVTHAASAPAPGGQLWGEQPAAQEGGANTGGHQTQHQQHQKILGELALRYNSMWHSTPLPALTSGFGASLTTSAPTPATSSAAITSLAAAAAVRSGSTLSPLMASLTSNQSTSSNNANAVTALSSVNAASDALRQRMYGELLAAAAAAPSPTVATPPHPRRKPTLDDLCSILGVAAKAPGIN